MNGCKDLTDSQLKLVNGCGSSYWLAYLFRIPEWFLKGYTRCCNRHDLKYQAGEALIEKMRADDELYDCMYYSAFHGSWYLKQIKLFIADIVYWCLKTKLSEICFLHAR